MPAAGPGGPGGAAEIGKDGTTAIVVGYDGSDPARGALAFAFGLARRDRARLWVCFAGALPALTSMSAQAAGPAVASRADEYDALRRDVDGWVRELAIDGECVRRDGEPARVLEDLAEEVRADMIVVGRSRSRAHAVIGSVAVHLVKHAGRPVVVVP